MRGSRAAIGYKERTRLRIIKMPSKRRGTKVDVGGGEEEGPGVGVGDMDSSLSGY